MKNKSLLTLLSIFFLTSCGFESSNLVEGNRYNSPVFEENYYTHWDNELKNAKLGISKEVNAINSFSKLYTIDSNVLANLDTLQQKYVSAEDYASDYKMNNVDDIFNYGYQSKLFDGQVECLGLHQLARVQIYDSGFSMRFSKESEDLSYFAMQFKATTDNTVDCYPVGSDQISSIEVDGQDKHDVLLYHTSTLRIHVGVYTKEDNEIVRNDFYDTFTNEKTNIGSAYYFYAFDLKEYNLSRCVGLSIEYEILSDELIEHNKNKGIDLDYSLMLYEMFLPYTSWN